MAYSPGLWLMANWLVKQNQPVSKIETKSDTNLRSLYESWSLERACIQTKKALEKIKGIGIGTQPQKRSHHTYLAGSERSSNELGYPHTEVGRQAGGIACEGWQDVHADCLSRRIIVQSSKRCPIILDGVPVTFVTDPPWACSERTVLRCKGGNASVEPYFCLHTHTSHLTFVEKTGGFTIQTKDTLLPLDLCGARWWWFDLLGCKLGLKMAFQEWIQPTQMSQLHSWGSKTWIWTCTICTSGLCEWNMETMLCVLHMHACMLSDTTTQGKWCILGVCNVFGCCPFEKSKLFSVCVYFGEPTSTLWCIFAYFFSSLRIAFSSCVTALFLLGLFWSLPRSHRLSSHSRLNAFVIQTKLNLGVRDTTPSWCGMREYAWSPYSSTGFVLQCVCTIPLPNANSLTQRNSFMMKKVLQTDMRLSFEARDCWSSHILSAMDGLTQSYMSRSWAHKAF